MLLPLENVPSLSKSSWSFSSLRPSAGINAAAMALVASMSMLLREARVFLGDVMLMFLWITVAGT